MSDFDEPGPPGHGCTSFTQRRGVTYHPDERPRTSSPSQRNWQPDQTTKTPTPGEWHYWTYGMDVKGWMLECGKLIADVRTNNGKPPYFLSINKHTLNSGPDLEALKREAEDHIVTRVSIVFPAYRLIEARVRDRTKI